MDKRDDTSKVMFGCHGDDWSVLKFAIDYAEVADVEVPFEYDLRYYGPGRAVVVVAFGDGYDCGSLEDCVRRAVGEDIAPFYLPSSSERQLGLFPL